MTRFMKEVVSIDNYPTDSPFSFTDLTLDVSLEVTVDNKSFVYTEDYLERLSISNASLTA